MFDLQIKCYIKNKLVMTIELQMTKERLLKQLKENKLIYTSSKTGGTEIVYLDKFDRITFNKNLEM